MNSNHLLDNLKTQNELMGRFGCGENLTQCERARAGKALFLKVAELVPKHHGRSKKQEPSGSASGSSSAAAAKSGKGGKKRK